MINDINSLSEFLPDAGSELLTKFETFFQLLTIYNQKINLVSKNTLPVAGSKHFTDCFMALNLIKSELESETTIFDFGSGNGFPGIIAALMFPKQKVIMVERDQRKAEFLKQGLEHLNLKNGEVLPGSVNQLADGVCNTIISRAMAPLPKFLLECRNVAKIGGHCFLLKGESWSSEFSGIPPQLFQFWDVSLVGRYDLPNDGGSRFLVRCARV